MSEDPEHVHFVTSSAITIPLPGQLPRAEVVYYGAELKVTPELRESAESPSGSDMPARTADARLSTASGHSSRNATWRRRRMRRSTTIGANNPKTVKHAAMATRWVAQGRCGAGLPACAAG